MNPDEIEGRLRKNGFINLSEYGLNCTLNDFLKYATNSSLIDKAREAGLDIDVEFRDNILVNLPKATHSYEAAFVAGFIRQQLLKSGQSFSLETVMSHISKIQLLELAKQYNFRNYLCLLYTSPSPRDLSTSRMPSSA